MKKVKINDNLLYVGDLEIRFENRILHIEQEKDKIFVLLNIPPNNEMNYDDYHNIYCYDFTGRKIWQIGERPRGDSAVYIMINIINSVLYANDFLGRRFIVNKETGTIGTMKITK